MLYLDVASLEVTHAHLPWPWIAISPGRECFAFPSSAGHIDSRVAAATAVVPGPGFRLPADLPLPTAPAASTGQAGPAPGLRAFAISDTAEHLAVVGTAGGASVLVTLEVEGDEVARTPLAALLGEGLVGHAVSFARQGDLLWISAESERETALGLVSALTHEVHGVLRSPALPPPAFHQLHVHPIDDAVLLLAACGEDGTFGRVAGYTTGPNGITLAAIATRLDGGGAPAGFVGFSARGSRLFLAEVDALRCCAWPDLAPLSSTPFDADFASAYSGAVIGERVIVDGEDPESGEDAVMVFAASGQRGAPARPPVPSGMWCGQLGDDAIVTVAAKGDPAAAQVVRLPTPRS